MNVDIRLRLDVFDHPKVKKLRRRLGAEAVEALLQLWLWAAVRRSSGRLKGLDAEDVELAARWNGAEGAFVRELCALRLLDEEDGTFVIHDWVEHQGYASQAEERSRRAKAAAQARWHGDDCDNQLNLLDGCGNDAQAMLEQCPSMQAASLSIAPVTGNRKPGTSNRRPEEKQKAEGESQKAGLAKPRAQQGRAAGPAEPAACTVRAAHAEAAHSAVRAIPSAPAAFAPAASATRAEATAKPLVLDGTGASCEPRVPASPASATSAPLSRTESAPAASSAPLPTSAGGKRSRRTFVPPQASEVFDYCQRNGFSIDAAYFVDYYSAKGWTLGGGQPVRDWQAVLRLWARRDRERAALPARVRGVPRSRGAAPPYIEVEPVGAAGSADIAGGFGVAGSSGATGGEVAWAGGTDSFAVGASGGNGDSTYPVSAAYGASLPTEGSGSSAYPAPGSALPVSGSAYPARGSANLAPGSVFPAPTRHASGAPYPSSGAASSAFSASGVARGMGAFRANSVHQAQLQERDLMARMLLAEARDAKVNHART